jgi:molecular chaperone DnaK (HSP70)
MSSPHFSLKAINETMTAPHQPPTCLQRKRQRPRTYSTVHLFALTVCYALCPQDSSAFQATFLSPYRSQIQRLPVQLHLSEKVSEGIGVGIDLGTTYSAVAYMKDGIPTIISVPHNGRTMPSVVSLDQSNQVWVGQQACEHELELGAYRNVKRVLGTGGKLARGIAKVVPYLRVNQDGKTYKKDNLLNQIHDAENFPTSLQSSLDSSATIAPEVISAHILSTLKAAAEAETGQVVTRAVIGVPAYFQDAQRQATVKAAELAGISKVKLLREPEAAAMAYGLGKQLIGRGDQDELVLVFDLGGGTYDVSMLVVGGGVTEIVSTSGNVKLGGSDFDFRVAEYMQKELLGNGVSTSRWGPNARNAMLRSAEVVRIFLSNNRRVDLALPLKEKEWAEMPDVSSVIRSGIVPESDISPAVDPKRLTHALCQLSRRDMEVLCREELQSLLRPVREVAIMSGALLPGDASPNMVDSALEMEEEDQAAMAFADFYNEDAEGQTGNADDVSPEMLLELQEMDMRATKKAQQSGRKRARNTAKQERKFRQEKRMLSDKAASQGTSDNVKVRDGINGRPISQVVLVGGATRMPAIGRLLAALTGVVPQKTVNPDEAVALGCAVHAAVLDGMEGMGTVLSPMQAAILRAVAEQQGIGNDFDDDDEDFDDGDEEEFSNAEPY